jgi:hypothetical protein
MTEAYALRLADEAENEYFRTPDAEVRTALADRARILRELASVLRYEEAARGRLQVRFARARQRCRGGAS